ncbi:DUF423 domain-containing protein [Brytella acorum]|uniref:DUF423 domain-containing protein n=1 Tax=Brytella acorum TaxID=2959299 RepID=A0AA35UY12_9PROT|nr:DUF423 domain-containing protein [Brytella acorum]MDF3625738.1 DUF423 domain-containing protein [Brytella acorum]CAI9121671.1 DUF423 domain-containing protein [Brytella acorum]
MTDIPPFSRPWRAAIVFAGLSGCLGVAIAALNAHLPERFFIVHGREMVGRAIDMQMWHTIVLLLLGLWGGKRFHIAALGFALGIVLFCGPVYSLALRGPDIAFLAPIGGTITMLAWLTLAASALRKWDRR